MVRQSLSAALVSGMALSFGALQAPAAGADRPGADPPLRVCVVGLVHGHVAGFFDAALRRTDLVIAGIAEPDTAVCGKYRRAFPLSGIRIYGSGEEMLDAERPEAVVVFTSTFDHRAAVELCSRKGVPVMMEKPLAVTLEDARAIAGAARRGSITVLVNYETTWYPCTHEVYRMTHANALGEIRKLIAHDGHRGPKEIGVGPEFLAWLTDPVLDGGGALMDFGCYGANLFTYFMDNQRPLAVTALTQQFKPGIYPRVDDEATLLLTYPRALGIIQASWNWPAGRKDVEVYGTSGSACTVGRDRILFRRGDDTAQGIAAPPLAAPADDPLSYLIGVVRKRVSPAGLSSLENNMIVSEILDAARRSAASGCTIRLGDEPGMK